MSAAALSGKQALCTCCGALFNTDRLFDRHRAGSYAKPGEWQSQRRCLSPAEMRAKGWRMNAHGFWMGKAGNPERFMYADPERRAEASAQ